jgi:hypothetical protein
MRPEEIERLRKICDEATKGPWRECNHSCDCGICACGPIIWRRQIGSAEWAMPSMPELRQVDLDAEFIATARTALPACLDEIERLHTFVAEWSERFGFLAENHARDSIDSIDEVACILNAKQADLVKANKVDLRTTLAFEAGQRDAEARIKELEEWRAKFNAVAEAVFPLARWKIETREVDAGCHYNWTEEGVPITDYGRFIDSLLNPLFDALDALNPYWRSSKKEGEC